MSEYWLIVILSVRFQDRRKRYWKNTIHFNLAAWTWRKSHACVGIDGDKGGICLGSGEATAHRKRPEHFLFLGSKGIGSFDDESGTKTWIIHTGHQQICCPE
jgi:hypothetical protein